VTAALRRDIGAESTARRTIRKRKELERPHRAADDTTGDAEQACGCAIAWRGSADATVRPAKRSSSPADRSSATAGHACGRAEEACCRAERTCGAAEQGSTRLERNIAAARGSGEPPTPSGSRA